MAILDSIATFWKQLDLRERYQFIGAFLGILLLLLFILVYTFYRSAYDLQRKIRGLNQQRDETAAILRLHTLVQKQQEHVDTLLKQDNNFKIKQFFVTTLQELNLSKYVTQDPEVVPQPLVEGYIERKLIAQAAGLTMQQIVELLSKIEKNERVYVKDISITLMPTTRLLDIILTVATFEATEEMEA